MEIEGTKRSSGIDEVFLSVKVSNPAINHFVTAIKRGRWFYDAVALCKKEGIYIDVSKRPVESRRDYIVRRIARLLPADILRRILKKLVYAFFK
jgi:hypothetical protein